MGQPLHRDKWAPPFLEEANLVNTVMAFMEELQAIRRGERPELTEKDRIRLIRNGAVVTDGYSARIKGVSERALEILEREARPHLNRVENCREMNRLRSLARRRRTL